MHKSARCTLIRSTEELVQLRSQWSELWRADPTATPFQSPGWLLPWWNQFGEGPLRTVAMYRERALIGLLPFYLYIEPASGCRKLLPLGVSTSDYLDGTFAPECAPEDIATALEYLIADGDFDSLEVTQLRSSSRLTQALQLWNPDAFQAGAGASTTRRPAVPHAELPAKIRRNTRYYQARAEQAGDFIFSIVTPRKSLEAYKALEDLHTARWHQLGQSGVLTDPRVQACHREAVPQLAAEDIARFYFLRLNGEIIAVLYTLLDPPGREQRTVYSYLTAFSPTHADLWPGSLLLSHVIDHIAHDGFAVIDFLRGDESYKSLWHTTRVPTHRFCAAGLSASASSNYREPASV